jgi:hypothetical protein
MVSTQLVNRMSEENKKIIRYLFMCQIKLNLNNDFYYIGVITKLYLILIRLTNRKFV